MRRISFAFYSHLVARRTEGPMGPPDLVSYTRCVLLPMLIAPQMIRKIIPDTPHLFYDAKGSHISDAIERGPLLCANTTLAIWIPNIQSHMEGEGGE